jgi:hypothetical protein
MHNRSGRHCSERKGPHYIGNKRQAGRLYQSIFQDERGAYFAELQQVCYERWGYRVPEAAADRALLRELARRSLAFENSFMETYLAFLRAELGQDDEGARQLAERRHQLIEMIL